MRRISLSAAILLAVVTGPLSGCAHMGGNLGASRAQKIEAKYDLARVAESEGKLDKARESYEEIYKKDSSNAEVCHRLGIVHAKQSNYEAAKRYLSEAHKLSPSNPEILNDWGYASYLANDLETAESVFQKALKVAPQNKRATNNLALVYGSQGKFDESLRTFRQVNGEAEANSNVAYLYAQHGEGKKALDHYSKALSLKPELKAAQNGMVEIAELQQKLEFDRSQIAQQQAAQQPVAQVAAQAQPKVYQELTASKTAPEVVSEKPLAARADVVTPVAQSNTLPEKVQNLRADTRTASADFAENAFLDDPATIQPRNAAPSTVAATQAPSRDTRIATAATVPAANAPTLADEFEEAPVEKKAVKTQTAASPVSQTLANVSDTAIPKATSQAEVDYVKLCPQATAKVLPLLQQLNSHDAAQMKLAMHKLGELGDEGVTGAPAARAALTHPDSYVRIHAALTLWRTEHNTTETVPVFVEGLRNTDGNVRSFAATALAIGPKVKEVVAPLTATLSDSNPFVRLHAAETLYQHPGQDAVALKGLIGHLDHKDANVRWLAIFIMGEVLPKSPEAVEALTLALFDSDQRIRAGAAFALGGLSKTAETAIPQLKELTTDQSPEVRQAAETAIQEIQGQLTRASAAR